MAKFEGFPFIVGWELTLACNLRCEHCGSTAGEPRRNELTTDEALAICDQLPELLVCEVDFTGGEPLVRPDWHLIAQRLQNLGIGTKLITNGLLLGKSNVANLRDSGISRVGVSLDGLEAVHDHIRGRKGAFKRVVRGIERLLNAGIPVTAITTLTSLNIDQLTSIYQLLQSLGVDLWQFQPIFPLGRAATCSDLTLSDQQYMKIGKFARQVASGELGTQPGLVPGDSFGYYTDADNREPGWGGCSAGLVLCGITSDGRIKGCLSMPDALIEGDLRQRDLWDIWFDDHSFEYNRKFTADDLGDNCRNCEMASRCRGGCTSMSYACTGNTHNDPYCFLGIGQRSRTQGVAVPLPKVSKRAQPAIA